MFYYSLSNFLSMYFKNRKNQTNLFLYVCLIVILLGCFLGYSLPSKIQAKHSEITNINISLFRIFIQNSFFAIALIIGAFTFNVLTICCCIFNGLIFGMYFKSSFINLGLEKTFALFIPHTLIEILWISLAIKLSYNIFCLFKIYVIKTSSLTRFGISVLKLKNQFLYIFFLIIIGCLVEYFITFKFLIK